jgi:hypothetical protein
VVTLTIRAPETTRELVVANTPSFSDARRFPVTWNVIKMRWALDASGGDRVARRVYVRFVGDRVDQSVILSDDITLDRAPPLLRRAVAGPATAGRSTVDILATDGTSGLAVMQWAAVGHGPIRLLPYRPHVRLAVARAFRLRVVDHAGNASAWKVVHVPRR